MARATRNAKLESRTARQKLKVSHEPYWVSIGRGLYLGYRKGAQGGSWIARMYLNEKYQKHKLSKADDYQDANGIDVLDYFQAQEAARNFADQQIKIVSGQLHAPVTVQEAIDNYLTWFKSHRKSYQRTLHITQAHIIPHLGNKLIAELTPAIIRNWHESLIKKPPRIRSNRQVGINYAQKDNSTEGIRKRKATANRILTTLKAALNHAWQDGLIASDEAWRKVKPFHHVNAPKICFLSVQECERLINTCEPGFRQLVRGALLTGCRYGELTRLTVNDVDLDRGFIHIRETKNGKPRYVPLTTEGITFFQQLTLGKLGSTLIFTRHDGQQWGTSHQSRRLKDACKRAKIEPAISFHVLRHTYGSLLASR